MLSQEIPQFLRAFGAKLAASRGQHFLIDERALEGIMTTAAVQLTDHVVEIGAGIGILTFELLKRAKHVTAIEIDKELISLLHIYVTKRALGSKSDAENGTRIQNLTIIHGNALSVPLPAQDYTIVANIPYHISSPLLKHAFLESPSPPRSLTLLLQREVAERICRTGRGRKGGMLAILVGLFGEPAIAAIVPSSSFLPPPKVDSAVLHVRCFPQPLVTTPILEHIFRLTRVAFRQKRKMLRGTIGKLPTGTEALRRARISSDRRPETLTIEEWSKLAEYFTEAHPSSLSPSHAGESARVGR